MPRRLLRRPRRPTQEQERLRELVRAQRARLIESLREHCAMAHLRAAHVVLHARHLADYDVIADLHAEIAAIEEKIRRLERDNERAVVV